MLRHFSGRKIKRNNLRDDIRYFEQVIILKENKMGGTYRTNEGKRNAYEVFVGKLKGRRPLGNSRPT
jgi:hypothetical protein